MQLRLDPASPVPLYHQIAEAIRYAIATGSLAPGDTLPPVRQAGAAWGVNLHTVRRGYAELAEHGLVEISPPHPARVLGSEAVSEVSHELERFVDSVLLEASSRYGLAPSEVAELVARRGARAVSRRPKVYVIECSEEQCRGHARELESRWEVTAVSWNLQRAAEPPAGQVVATYFHYNDIRRRWPHRLREIHFATIQPDPALLGEIEGAATANGTPGLVLCEFDETMAGSIAADLSVLLPAKRFNLQAVIVEDAAEPLTTPGRWLLLYPPRVWATLSESQRADARAIEVRYVFPPDEIEKIGERFGWDQRRSVA